MTTVLVVLTLVYVAILVLALAVGLCAILWFLDRARADLTRIKEGLILVNKNVEPLQGALSAVNDGLADLLGNLKSADEHLAALATPKVAGR
jgi:hypothetical protein